MSGINETIPAMWWSIYTSCLKQGFTPVQAFLLLQTQILQACPYGINGTSGTAPDEKPKEDNLT